MKIADSSTSLPIGSFAQNDKEDGKLPAPPNSPSRGVVCTPLYPLPGSFLHPFIPPPGEGVSAQLTGAERKQQPNNWYDVNTSIRPLHFAVPHPPLRVTLSPGRGYCTASLRMTPGTGVYKKRPAEIPQVLLLLS